MNLLTLTQRLWLESGRLGVGPTAVSGLVGDPARALGRIQNAWRDLQSEPRLWAWMRKTVTKPLTAGQSSYTATDLTITDLGSWWPESTMYRPEVLDDSGLRLARLDWLPYEEFRESFLVATSSSTPTTWSTAPNQSLLLGPAPRTTGWQLRIDYKQAGTELTAATDSPGMPADFHMLLVWMALEQMAGADENPSDLKRAMMNRRTVKALLVDSQAEQPNFLYLGPLA